MTYSETYSLLESIRARIEGYQDVLLPKYLESDLDKAILLQEHINELNTTIELKQGFLDNCKVRQNVAYEKNLV